jgi:glycosyltransferase involved in cell wall biosynthesis
MRRKLYKLLSVLLSLRRHANRKKFLTKLREYIDDITIQPQLNSTQSDTPYRTEILHSENRKTLLVVHEFSSTGAPYAVLYLARALFSLYGIKPVVISPKDGAIRAEFEHEGFTTIVDPLLFNYQTYSSEACDFIAGFDRVIVTSLASFGFIRYFRGIAKHLTWWIHETGAGFTAIASMTADLPLFFAACESIWLGGPLCFPFALQYAPQNKLHLLLYGCVDSVIPHRLHKSGKMIFSLVGSVENRKGQDIFLDAIERLPEELRSKAVFRIIGSPLPHDESIIFYKKISTRAAQIPEVECIENMPSDKLLEFYAETDVLVSASRDDPMPIVITQGLMFSKLCLCSSAIGHAQLLEDNQNALIFTNESAQELSEKIAWLLQNPAKLAVLGTEGRKLYEKYFLMSSFVNNLEKLMLIDAKHG